MGADRTEGHEHVEDVAAVDLATLDPTVEAASFDARVARVMDDARFELLRRRRGGVLGTLPTHWGRVAWPAAAAVALASLAVLRTSEPALAAIETVSVEEEMALAVGVPEALAVWVAEPGAPAISEILIGWERDE